jgi:hypothetical protein
VGGRKKENEIARSMKIDFTDRVLDACKMLLPLSERPSANHCYSSPAIFTIHRSAAKSTMMDGTSGRPA